VIERLSAEMRRALERPEVKATFATVGLVVMPLAPEPFDEFLRNETRMFAAVIRESNIKAE
jgi:tripartite-type tricarboxylate transporter receptor subunit TctC